MKISETILTQEKEMSQRSRRGFLLSLIIPFTLSQAACTPPSQSQKLAEQFIEAYYVRFSVLDSLAFTSGLAKEKLEKQLGLLQGAQGPEPNQDRPRVTYKLIDKMSASADTATYIFEVRVHKEDVGKRMVFIKMRRDKGKWLVTQFTEDDAPPS